MNGPLAVTGASRICAIPVIILLVGAVGLADEGEPLGTLIRGVQHRQFLLDPVVCEMKVVVARSREYSRARERAYSESDLSLIRAPVPDGTTVAEDELTNVLLGDERAQAHTEAASVRCEFSTSMRHWRIEEVALTNRGQPAVTCGLATPPCDTALPPRLLYCCRVYDTDTEYIWDRSLGEGSIRPFDGTHVSHIYFSDLWSIGVVGLTPSTLQRVVSQQSVFLMQRGSLPRDEQVIAHVNRTSSDTYNVWLWHISPKLGFAVTRSEMVELQPAPNGDRPTVKHGHATLAADFREKVDGIYVPHHFQIDFFDEGFGGGTGSWTQSRVYSLDYMEVTEGADIITPRRFPFDARTWDLRPGAASMPAPRGMPSLAGIEVAAPPWIDEDYLASLASLLRSVPQ